MRGTTPTITLRFNTVDLSAFKCYITFSQCNGRVLLTKVTPDVVAEYANGITTMSVTLTQAETLLFRSKDKIAKVQMRAIDQLGKAVKSKVKEIPIDELLLGGVISYNGS